MTAKCVGCPDTIGNQAGAYGKWLMVGSFTFGDGALGYLRDNGMVGIDEPDLGQSDWQSDPAAKAQRIFDFGARAAFDHQLHDQAEGDLLAVQEMMGLRRHGQAVVNRMRNRKPARLKTKTGQQRIGFDDPLQCGGHRVALCGSQRVRPVRDQCFIAQARDRARRKTGAAPKLVWLTRFDDRARL